MSFLTPARRPSRPVAFAALFLLALGLVLGTTSSTQAQCVGAKALFQSGSSDYLRCNTSTTYAAASTACQGVAAGWHLATMTDAAEGTFLYTNRGGNNRWVGLDDLVTEGIYVWVDGTPFSFTNWGAGEPDGAAEDCIRVRRLNGTWQDRACTENNRFWCEGPTLCGNGLKTSTEACDDGNTNNGDGCTSTCTVESGWYCVQPSGQNYNASVCTAGCDNTAVAGTNAGSSYIYCPLTATWGNAQNACRAVGAGWDLTTISSLAENTYVNTLATQAVFLGLNDIALEGTFAWSNGAGVAYTNWLAGQPDDMAAPADCAIMNNNAPGNWQDQSCGTATRYVCEGPNNCGNGAITGGEFCDDGNSTNGDGCDASCNIEANFSCVGAPSVCHPTCGTFNWAWNSYNATTWSEYYYCRQTKSWDLAAATCTNLSPGWHLVTVDNITENGFIGGLQDNNKWIGLNDQTAEGTFVWADGSPLTYTNWNGTNPNGGATQDCVRMRNTANNEQWDDRPCTDAAVFVCEGPSICGNGIVGTPETCDDGNAVDGDGCSSGCAVEDTYECTVPDTDGAPTSICTAPMHVAIADVALVPTSGGVALEWDTTTEAGTLGFIVSRRSGAKGAWTPVHSDTLVGLQDAPQGGRYQLRVAAGAAKDVYRITEITRAGRSVVWEGQPTWDRNPGRALALGSDGFAAAKRIMPVQRPYLSSVTKAAMANRFQLRAGRVPTGAVISVHNSGVQALSVSDLAAALAVSENSLTTALTQGTLSLTDQGTAVPWEYDVAHGKVRFLGRDADSVYTSGRPYVAKLTTGTITNVMDESSATAGDVGTGLVTTNLEQDLFAGTVVSPDPESDYWFWGVLYAGSGAQKQFTTSLELGAAPSANGILTVRVYGAWELDATRGQNVQVLVNGHVAGTFLVDAIGPKSADVAVQSAWLTAGTNSVVLKASWAGIHGGGMYVDGITLSQQQPLRTGNASLGFEAVASDTVGVDVVGASASVFDLTTGERILPGLSDAGGGQVRAAFDTETGHRYLVTADGSEAAPTARASYDAGLTTTSFDADYVVITPSELRAQADRLAGLRAAQGLSTFVVELNDVYDAFAGGLPTPRAMNTFLKHAASHWQNMPAYVVLLGDGSLDYRGIGGAGPGLIPPLLVRTRYGLYASDTVLGDVTGDGVPEVVVGRLPVRTDVEANRVIDRIAAYEAGATLANYEHAALLVSGTDRGAKFSESEARLEETLPEGIAISNIATTKLNAAQVHNDLVGSLNLGAFWFNYEGHGGMTNLDDDSILTVDDVPSLTNAARLPIVTGMTCNMARFEVPGFDSLADALLLGETGGAIAVWGATGVTQSKDATGMGAHFGDALINEGAYGGQRLRLGEVVNRARTEALANGEIDAEQLSNFALLGDPALRLPDLSSLGAETLETADDDGILPSEVATQNGDGGTPAEATDGGASGGGGLCAMDVGNRAPGAFTWMLFLAAAVLVVVRRRRK